MTGGFVVTATPAGSGCPADLERVPDLPYRVGGVPVDRWTLVHTASYVRQVLGVDARVIGRHVWAAEGVVVLQRDVDAWNDSRAIGAQE